MPSCSITWGKMYENGYGVEQDYVKAAAWYQLVAEQGREVSQQRLEFLQENKTDSFSIQSYTEQGFLDLQQFYAFLNELLS